MPSVEGEYRVCTRCQVDTDTPGVMIGRANFCALVRFDWMCGSCLNAHRDGCDICTPHRRAA